MAEDKLETTPEQWDEQRVREFAKNHIESGGNEGVRFLRGPNDPLVKVTNRVFAEARRRKVN